MIVKNRKPKGYILIITILAIAALFFFAILMVKLQASERKTASRGESDIIAQQAAKAGIDYSIYQLSKDFSWNTGFNNQILPHSNASFTVTFNNTQKDMPYSTNNSQSASAVEGYNGRKVAPGVVHIVSAGKFGSSMKIEEAMLSSGGVLFEDDFVGRSGEWNETVGQFFNMGRNNYNLGHQSQNAGEHRTFAGNTSWQDYTIETTARLVRGQGYGIYFRTTNEPNINSYVFQYDPGYDTGRQGSFIMRKVVNGGEQSPFARTGRVDTVFAGPSSWWFEKERNIKIEVKGNTFTAYVDDVKVVEGSDSQFTNGRVGYRIWGSTQAYFSDIKVSTGSGGLSVISRW